MEWQEQQILRPERGAAERTGLGITDNRTQSPLEIFNSNVEILCGQLKIGKDQEFLTRNSGKLEYIEYKNPQAYVLGYIMSKYSFDQAKRLLSRIDISFNIKLEDIIRYGRLWEMKLAN